MSITLWQIYSFIYQQNLQIQFTYGRVEDYGLQLSILKGEYSILNLAKRLFILVSCTEGWREVIHPWILGSGLKGKRSLADNTRVCDGNLLLRGRISFTLSEPKSELSGMLTLPKDRSERKNFDFFSTSLWMIFESIIQYR